MYKLTNPVLQVEESSAVYKLTNPVDPEQLERAWFGDPTLAPINSSPGFKICFQSSCRYAEADEDAVPIGETGEKWRRYSYPSVVGAVRFEVILPIA